MRLHSLLGLLLYTLASAPPARATRSHGKNALWSGWGGNLYNNRWVTGPDALSTFDIPSLKPHCQKTYGVGVSAAPALHNGIAYYPTWDGLLVALDYDRCITRWSINVTTAISAFTNASQPSLISRTSPQIGGDIIYFGTLTKALAVVADLRTGKILALTPVNTHKYAVITMSPTLYNNLLIIGASSTESGAPDCCSFIGNVVALRFNHSSQKLDSIWDVPMLPKSNSTSPNDRWSGAAVWGSQPSIDRTRSQVFIGTGNLYQTPTSYSACVNSTQNFNTSTTDPCLPKDVWQDSVLAIDIPTGRVNWARQLNRLDSWNAACGYLDQSQQNTELCPGTPGPDADFGMAPTYVPASKGMTPNGTDTIVAAQKNGNMYALSASNGTSLWTLITGPGSEAGGVSWGIAVDYLHVYFTQINPEHQRWTIQPGNRTVVNTWYGAVSLETGKIIWETPVPGNSSSISPPTVAGNVVLVGMTAGQASSFNATGGGLIALESQSGKVLRQIDLDNTVSGGVAVGDGYVLFGSGYRSVGSTGGTAATGRNGSFWVFTT